MYNSTLKAAIEAAIHTPAEPKINGSILQQKLLEIIAAIDAGAVFKGVATPASSPIGESNCFYLASTEGTYTNFLDTNGNAIALAEGEVALLASIYNNDVLRWTKNLVPGRGENSYLHIMYASTEPTQDRDMHDTFTSGDKWIGICADANDTAPDKYDAYQWAKFVGDNGAPGADGHNPNLGTFLSTDTFPATGQEGDYITVITDDGQGNVTSKTWVYDANATGAHAPWTETNRDSNDAYFHSGQLLIDVDIDDTHLDNPASGSLAKAEDVAPLKSKLSDVDYREISVLEDKIQVNGKIVNGTTGEFKSSGSSAKIFVFAIPANSTHVKFFGMSMPDSTGTSDVYLKGYSFGVYDGEDFTPVGDYHSTFERGTSNHWYTVPVPANASVTHFVTTVQFNASVSVIADFNCFFIFGESITDKINRIVGENKTVIVNNLESDSETAALSAKMGKELNTKIRQMVDTVEVNCTSESITVNGNIDGTTGELVNISTSYKSKIIPIPANSRSVRFLGMLNPSDNMTLATNKKGYAFGSYTDGVFVPSSVYSRYDIKSDASELSQKEYEIPVPEGVTHFAATIKFTSSMDIGSDFYCYFAVGETIVPIIQRYSGIIELTNDDSDRTEEIRAKLLTGVCKLGVGTFVVNKLDMPANSELVGSGNGTRLLLTTEEDASYCIKMATKCKIFDLTIEDTHGYDINNANLPTQPNHSDGGVVLDGDEVKNRHGILYLGNGANTDLACCFVSNVCVTNFYGGAITLQNTSTSSGASLTVSNCVFNRCGIGINIAFKSEYNRFNNVLIRNCKYGIVNNGGNNNFCGLSLSGNGIGYYANGNKNSSLGYDGTYTSTSNDGHGVLSSCSINHSGLGEMANQGFAIVVRGTGSGFIFNSCRISYGNIYVRGGGTTMISSCQLFGHGDPVIIDTKTNQPLILFSCFFDNLDCRAYYGDNNTLITNSYSNFDEEGNLQRAKLVSCYNANAVKGSWRDYAPAD